MQFMNESFSPNIRTDKRIVMVLYIAITNGNILLKSNFCTKYIHSKKPIPYRNMPANVKTFILTPIIKKLVTFAVPPYFIKMTPATLHIRYIIKRAIFIINKGYASVSRLFSLCYHNNVRREKLCSDIINMQFLSG